MGDRTYTSFTIPCAAVRRPGTIEQLAKIFDFPEAEYAKALAAEPLSAQESYNTGMAVRLIEDQPCLVIEDEECNYGGSDQELALRKAGIPYIHYHAVGGNYDAGRSAFVPGHRGRNNGLAEVACDMQSDIVMHPRVKRLADGDVDVGCAPIALATVKRYFQLHHAVLHWQQKTLPKGKAKR